MSRGIVTFRKSRRDRTCEDATWAHDRNIKAGDVYARVSYPPHEPGAGWATYTLCADCGEKWKASWFDDYLR
jgi:hypothetical protein